MKNEIEILSLDDLDMLELEERLEMTFVLVVRSSDDICVKSGGGCDVDCGTFRCESYQVG